MEQPTSDFIARRWPLEDVHVEETLQQYATRAVYGVRSAQGRYVIKMYEDASALGLVAPSPEQIDQGLNVFDYLAARGFRHAPALLRTRTGERFVREGGGTAYVIERLAGDQPAPTADTYRQLGRIAAALRSFRDYPHPYPIPVAGVLAELAAQATNYPFHDDFLRLLPRLSFLEDHTVHCLLHAEINTANALQTPDGRMYLLDWDAAGTGSVALMAGYPLLICFVDEYDCTFRRDEAAAFYDAYVSREEMTPDEKEALFAAALLHALRYLPFHNTAGRWARVCWALEHKNLLLSVLPTKR
jgi:Ser/Thr protein kinase RdoA (MazF antagonist)